MRTQDYSIQIRPVKCKHSYFLFVFRTYQPRFVCSYAKDKNIPTFFRSYRTKHNEILPSVTNCRIWEAARATSAAPTFFDPMVIGLQAYVDGATGMNNPVECVLDEAQMLWPDALSRIQSLVSIGTGKPESKDFGDNLKDIVLTLKSIATDTENTHLRFAKCIIDRGLQGRYFRFNVDRGMANVRLDDHEKIGSIEAATQAYIKSPDVKYNAELFTGVLPADTGA